MELSFHTQYLWRPWILDRLNDFTWKNSQHWVICEVLNPLITSYLFALFLGNCLLRYVIRNFNYLQICMELFSDDLIFFTIININLAAIHLRSQTSKAINLLTLSFISFLMNFLLVISSYAKSQEHVLRSNRFLCFLVTFLTILESK